MNPFNNFRDYPILPGEVAILEGALHKALEERNLTMGSDEAEEVAQRIIKLYQSGVRDPEEIWQMIRTI
ncbi:hypothetical protein EHS39_28755 [Ensifer sp. MPMI2T]|nr:hypothetical protein EHS39_28755 [Ensifer sp. MPMI2T]